MSSVSRAEGENILLIQAAAARAAARDRPEYGRALANEVIAACGPGDREARIVALRTRGWAERELYLYEESRASLNRAVRLARDAGLSERLAESLISRSSLNLEVGRAGAAIRDVAAARRALGGESTAELDSQEALIAMKFGHHARAVEIGLRARSRIGKDTDPVHSAVILINLGESLSHLGRWREADAIFAEAAAVGESLGRLYLGLAVQTHAAAIVRAGRLTEGLAAFDRSEQLMTEAGWPLGEHHLERIESLATLGLVNEADDAVRRASGYFERDGMGLLMFSEVRLRQARLCLGSGRFEEAAAAATAAADLFRRQRRFGYAAQSEVVAIEARHRQGRGSGADLRRAQRACRVLMEAGAYGESVEADLIVARLALDQGRRAEARERLVRVQAASRGGGTLLRVKGRLAEALEASLDGEEARLRRAARRGLDEVARFRATLPTTELRALASGHGVELSTLGLRSTLRSGRCDHVLEWMERGRLASALTDPPRPVDATLDEAFARLRDVLGQQRTNTEDLDRVARLRLEQDRLETRIQRRLRTLDPQASQAGRIATAAELTAGLRGTLVEFASVDGCLHAVTLGAQRRISAVGDVDDVMAEVRALQFGLRRILRARNAEAEAGARAGIARSLEVLDRRLVHPLGLGAGAEVVIVPTAPLFAVPWHALPSLTGRRVAVSPSATVWLRAGRAQGADGPALIAAGPRLAAASEEVDAIGAIHRGSTVLAPPTATVARVRVGLDGARLAHLACHGTFRSDNPSFSNLEFADGPLTVLDLESLGRAPDVVVLASCDSGASQALPGDELRGFLSALFMLGTRAVIASSVPVPDVETTPLMAAIHRGLAAGLSVGEALDTARAGVDTATPAGLVMATAFAQFGDGDVTVGASS